MGNIITAPSFFPRRMSMYVPAMKYASDVNMSGDTRIGFGTPALANATWLLSALDTTVAGSTTTLSNSGTITEPYGRCLTFTASGGTLTVTVTGFDYLGQPMTEALAATPAITFVGVKAFKYITSVAWTASAFTLNLGTNDKLGLPYKAIKCLSEEFLGANVATLGTLVTASVVDPATSVTTDPRGTFDPQSTLNGTSDLSATFLFSNTVNSSNNGGLHGIAHYSA